MHLESELEMLKLEKENIVHNYAVITKDELKEYKRQAVKEFTERLKNVIYERDYLQGYAEIGLIEEIDELLKEYEK